MIGKDVKMYGENYEKLGDYYSSLAFPYYQIGAWGKAENLLKQAIRYNIKNRGPYDASVIKVYNNLGSLYLDKYDNDQANIYINKALSLLLSHYGENNHSVGIAYMNLGASYGNQNAFRKALEYNFKAIDNLSKTIGPKNPYLSPIYRNTAICFNKLGHLDSARLYLDKAVDLNKALYGDQDPEIVRTYNVIADIDLQNNDFDGALAALIKAKVLGDRILPEKHLNKGETLNLLGNYYSRKAQYRKSLQYIQKALIALIPAFDDTNFYKNPKPTEFLPNQVLIDALTQKASVLYSAYKKEGEDKMLMLASENAEFTDHAIDLLRIDYQMPNSKELLIEKALPFYKKAVEIAITQYDRTSNYKYLEQAFKYAEKSKSILLMENLKDSHDKIQYVGIPDSVSSNEEELREEIKFYREQLMQAKTSNDSAKIVKYEDYFFKKKRDYDLLVERLKKEHPDYYRIKHQISYEPIRRIQKLMATGETIIEYFKGEQNDYVFIINTKQAQYLKLPESDSLNHNINSFILNLREGHFDREVAFELYNWLVKPAIEEIDKSHARTLTFVPEGALNYLPFEVLVDSNPRHSKKVDYLIDNYTVDYLHSASLLDRRELESQETSTMFLGFAPEFDRQANPLLATRTAKDSLLVSGLEQLPMARHEVKASADIWDGNYYINDQATEENFKQFAPGAGIIHLATHAIINDENPLYSKLVFAPEKDTLEDGLLNTYELYNMHLHAQLACLSACNTGLGKLRSGEGVISLARGFLYAGVPNILMSLWSVPDQSTSRIMQYFYEALKSGEGKADALRTAKLKYLSHADENTSNPYYWAAFTLVGDNRPIDQENTGTNTIFILSSSLLMVLVFIGFFYRKKPQNLKA